MGALIGGALIGMFVEPAEGAVLPAFADVLLEVGATETVPGLRIGVIVVGPFPGFVVTAVADGVT